MVSINPNYDPFFFIYLAWGGLLFLQTKSLFFPCGSVWSISCLIFFSSVPVWSCRVLLLLSVKLSYAATASSRSFHFITSQRKWPRTNSKLKVELRLFYISYFSFVFRFHEVTRGGKGITIIMSIYSLLSYVSFLVLWACRCGYGLRWRTSSFKSLKGIFDCPQCMFA